MYQSTNFSHQQRRESCLPALLCYTVGRGSEAEIMIKARIPPHLRSKVGQTAGRVVLLDRRSSVLDVADIDEGDVASTHL